MSSATLAPPDVPGLEPVTMARVNRRMKEASGTFTGDLLLLAGLTALGALLTLGLKRRVAR
ncbi:MAG TPA: hypothetical protein VFM14_13875 [Gemmatimonadales bacterium]|nr:hypothetical protein [Gemmatimonadales bacterium]